MSPSPSNDSAGLELTVPADVVSSVDRTAEAGYLETGVSDSGELEIDRSVPHDADSPGPVRTGSGGRGPAVVDAEPADGGTGSVQTGSREPDITDRPDRTVRDAYERPLAASMPVPRMDPVEAALSHMSLEERIAQRFIAWLRSEDELERMSEFVRTRRPGGIVMYPKNFTSYDRLAAAIGELSRAAGSGDPVALPFICTDQEGGRVSAFRFSETFDFPAPWYWARYDDPEFIRSAAYIQGRELERLGFNLNLAPVLDLSERPDSSVVGDRAMGGEPGRVARFARAYLEGLSAAGVLAVAKHFPGHGVSGIDSHETLPVSMMTEGELFGRDLVPFASAIADGVPIVMTGHILFPRIDPENPVTFSPYMIRTVLRGRLGFEGVVMSDALEMGALSKGYRIEETLVRAIRAGVDLLLIGSLYDPARLIVMVKDAVLSGELTEAEIDEGTRRILRLKFAAGLLPGGVD